MNANERSLLRELAKKLQEYSKLPCMEERRQLWYDHNDLKTQQPVIMCAPEACWQEILPASQLQCTTPELRRTEWILRARIMHEELIHDDDPVEDTWDCPKAIAITPWKIKDKGEDYWNSNVYDFVPSMGAVPCVWEKNYHFDATASKADPLIDDFDDDEQIDKLIPPQIIYDEQKSRENLELHQDIFGDILNVRSSGPRGMGFGLISSYITIRGYENALYDLYDYPEEMHRLLEKITDSRIALEKQMEADHLFYANHGCHYCGSGGLGYTREIAVPEDQPVKRSDMWGFAEAQEFVAVSPEMTKAFSIDYECRYLSGFHFAAYGCCESLEDKLKYILDMPNIRRISVCPWANVSSMQEQIGMKAVFSCKPNPSYLVESWDEDLMDRYMMRLTKESKGSPVEFILKDTHTIGGDPAKLRNWTDLCRRCIDKVYG